MEAIGRDAVTNFFNVMVHQVNMSIAKFNLANNDTIYKIGARPIQYWNNFGG